MPGFSPTPHPSRINRADTPLRQGSRNSRRGPRPTSTTDPQHVDDRGPWRRRRKTRHVDHAQNALEPATRSSPSTPEDELAHTIRKPRETNRGPSQYHREHEHTERRTTTSRTRTHTRHTARARTPIENVDRRRRRRRRCPHTEYELTLSHDEPRRRSAATTTQRDTAHNRLDDTR